MAGFTETDATDAMNRLSVQPMRLSDLAGVMQIEVAAYPQPWTEGTFRDCLKAGYSCDLYALSAELVGYSVVSMAAGEAHLLNLCINPLCQGDGLGREALEHVLKRVKSKQVETLYLEVRVSNGAARKLYDSAGFNEIGQRFNYYPSSHGREDALVFAKTLM